LGCSFYTAGHIRTGFSPDVVRTSPAGFRRCMKKESGPSERGKHTSGYPKIDSSPNPRRPGEVRLTCSKSHVNSFTIQESCSGSIVVCKHSLLHHFRFPPCTVRRNRRKLSICYAWIVRRPISMCFKVLEKVIWIA